MRFDPAQGLGSLLRLAATALLLAAGAAKAENVNLTYLEGQNPVAADAVTSHGPELFGDRVNLFNGSLEFEHTDISLPGNNALPVALVRRYTPGQSKSVRGQFGDWDLEVPRIGGTFSNAGWLTYTGGTNRCSSFTAPPELSNGISSQDYWRGTRLYVPGQGAREVLQRGANTTAPSNGYWLVAAGEWRLSCITEPLAKGAGEGFMAVSPAGVRYRFDWMASRLQTGVKKNGKSAGRMDVYLMATQVSDRFGNFVNYTYDPANPLLLTRIESSDGRVITITNVGGRAVSAFDGTRTFSYGYSAAGSLATVQQPDGSRWSFNLDGMTPVAGLEQEGEGADCDWPGSFSGSALVGTIVHPSGATGTFTTSKELFGRTNVQRACWYVPNSKTLTTGAVWPRYFATQALINKQISGPGLPTMQWQYQYVAPGGWVGCTTPDCVASERTVTVTDPAGYKTKHTFGSRWRVNEGQLLRVEVLDGANVLRTTTYRYRQPSGQPYPEPFGTSLLTDGDWLSVRHRPQDQKKVTQQVVAFTWQVNSFDSLARPVNVTKSSDLGYSRSETTAYFDHLGLWVLGQPSSVTDGAGRVPQSHTYDGVTANRLSTAAFGRTTDTYTWNTDGTLRIHQDGANHPTTFSNFFRGVPRRVDYADGTFKTAVVDNLGAVTSRTNQVGTTTAYGYDAMGRLASITYPNETGLSYFPTTQVFEQVAAPEYGLAGGHWRQTVRTGNATTVRYFDALWRERLKHVFDASDPAGTASMVETRWNHQGRKTFTSYAQRSLATVDAIPAPSGTQWTPDGLGRVVLQVADSELGPLSTKTDYLDGFLRRVTNPRSYVTTFAFQAFDEPSEDHIAQVLGPEGLKLEIARDDYGKPKSITRSGTYGTQAQSVTRSYTYDANQRLCKTVEPESDATLQDYDAANNIAWRASGLATGTPCGDAGAAASRQAISYTYDARNRLLTTRYGDGSPGVTRTYTPDGLPETINTPGFNWTLAYNNRRLMVGEGLSTALGTWAFGYGFDAHGSVATMVYPGNLVLQYQPDALGRPRMVSGYASSVSYHPNGALAGYTANNGVAFSMTQNLRGLPWHWTHGGVVHDVYGYDANGNVLSIADQLQPAASRSMGYDGLDRLKTANGVWGIGSFDYDALDNLVTSQVGGRVLVHRIKPETNRLESLTGSLNLLFGYDANGNVVQRGSQSYQFDTGNRMTAATGVSTHAYDGHGRRSWTQLAANGHVTWRAYGQSGRLLLSSDSQKGTTWHVHLGGKVIAETNSLSGTRWLHADVLGSPVAATVAGAAVQEWTRYEPYGGVVAGSNPDGVGFAGHVNDPTTGLVYMQQRYYDPIAGRFLSIDPVATFESSGAHFNRFEYANNNPYRYIDPDGRQSCTGSHISCTGGGLATGFSGFVFGATGSTPSAPLQHPIIPVLKDLAAGAVATFPGLAPPPAASADIVAKTTVIAGPFEVSRSTNSSGSSTFFGVRSSPGISLQQTVENKFTLGGISGPTVKFSGSFGLGQTGIGGTLGVEGALGSGLTSPGVQGGIGFAARGSGTGGGIYGLGTPALTIGWTFKSEEGKAQ